MENNSKELKLVDDDQNINVFKMDYENQNIEKNVIFNKWKQSMNNKYKGKGKFYKCPYGNHYFY